MDARACEHKKGNWIPKVQLCDFKKMKSPSYSSMKWLPHKNGFEVDRDHIVAKGTLNRLMNDETLKSSLKMEKIKTPIHIKVKGGILRRWTFEEDLYQLPDTVRIGENFFSQTLIFQVAEEIYGEKILLKEDFGEREIAKRAVGKIIELEAFQRKNNEFSSPLIIEGNRGYYMIAPIIKDED